MNKLSIKLLTLLAIMIAMLTLVACNGTVNEIENATVIKPIFNADTHDVRLSDISGIVRDSDYQPVKNTEIYFGENKEFVQKTNDKGEFSFYFIDPEYSDPENQIDYLSLDTNIYEARVYLAQANLKNAETKSHTLKCFVVALKKTEDIDPLSDLFVRDFDSEHNQREHFFFDIRIATPGVLLPKGYQTRETILDKEVATAIGEGTGVGYTLTGVKVSVNGKYVAHSNNFGIGFDFLIKGTVIKLEYKDFTFGLTTTMDEEEEPEEQEEEGPRIIDYTDEEGAFIINGSTPQGAKFFAFTNNLNAVKENFR